MQQSATRSPKRLNYAAKWIIGFSCANLAILCMVSYLLYGISETWWVNTVLTYAPRAPYLIPTLGLIFASLFWHRGSLGINLVSAAIVCVPVMGLCIPSNSLFIGSSKSDGQMSLKIVSCNVQEFKPDFQKVLEEIAAINPDVVVLQEALFNDLRLEQHFRDWHKIRQANFWVGSRYPLSLISGCEVPQFGGRTAGVVFELQTPAATVVLADIHQMTARHGLTELNRSTLINGDGTKEVEAFESERYFESIELRKAIDSARGDRPLIVCGDFNAPVSCNLFQKHWGDLQSSFDLAGFGYGYTAPCKGNRFWSDNLPWARIDHILCSKEWTVRQCQIGHSDGSDHRLIAATVVLNAEKEPVKTRSE